MPEFNLIKLEGKPIEKLIEVISNGIGTLYKPRSIRKEADAKAYEIGIIEGAKTKALNEGKEKEAETYLRIQERLIFKETERQNNIDRIAEKTAKQLELEENVSEEPVNKDWSKRFFNIAEDVSDEEMQEIWARILAGEIKKPNSYSLRTLELLKNLSKWEAEVFMKFAKLAISSGNTSFILNFKNEKLLEDKYKLNFKERLLLEELGLLTANDLQFKVFATKQEISNTCYVIGNQLIHLEKPKNQPEQQLQVLVFTKIGQELLNLVQSEPAELEYIQLLASKLRKNDEYKLKYSVILRHNPDGSVNHSPMIDIPLTDKELKTKEEKNKNN